MPLPVSAQTSDPAKTDKAAPQKPTQSVDKVEVTARQSDYDAREDDTATKIVVTAEEIKKYGDTQVLDVFKRLPGVTVLGNSIRLRALGSGYTQIVIHRANQGVLPFCFDVQPSQHGTACCAPVRMWSLMVHCVVVWC